MSPTERTCFYCKKKVIDFVKCSMCNAAFYHDSCAKKSGALKGSLVKCPPCSNNLAKASNDSVETQVPGVSADLLRTLQKLEDSMAFLSNKFDALTLENQKALKELKEVKQENVKLQTKVKDLERRVHELEIKECCTSVEIIGTKIKNESPKNVVMELANDLLGGSFDGQELVACTKKDTKSGPMIIAKFTTVEQKNHFLNLRRKRKLESNLLRSNQGETTSTNIYINEQLTFFNNNLFKMAYKLKKDKQFKYCWSKNGRVFIKKSDDCRAIYVYNEDIINDLRNSN